jgi:hypothetical protein
LFCDFRKKVQETDQVEQGMNRKEQTLQEGGKNLVFVSEKLISRRKETLCFCFVIVLYTSSMFCAKNYLQWANIKL